jgi:hypothetical protein
VLSLPPFVFAYLRRGRPAAETATAAAA